MPTPAEYYFEFIRDKIAPLYFRVKTTIIEAEYWEHDQRAYIAPFNEMRNTLDHLMKCFNGDDNMEHLEKNLLEGKVHMIRAGYDIYEVFISNIALYITDAIEKYPSEVISRIFPKYYEEIQPKLVDIRNTLTDVRSNKKIDSDSDLKPFDIYEAEKEELKKIVATIDGHQPALAEETRKHRLRKWFNRGWTLIIGIIAAVAATVIVMMFLSPSP